MSILIIKQTNITLKIKSVQYVDKYSSIYDYELIYRILN